MPELRELHKFVAVLKGGFEITTVEATDLLDAKFKAADEMKVMPLKKYFDGWARDGYRMKDNGPV